MRRIIRRLGPTLGLVCSITLFQAMTADAQTWTGASATTNNWSDGTNWSSTPNPPANNGTALITYSNDTTVPRTTSTVDTNFDINTLTFQNGALGYIIDNSGGSTLTIEGGITDSSVTTETITAPVILGTTNATTQTWTVDGTQLNVNGPITAAAGFTGFVKAGSGILQLGSTTNNFGPITVSGGTLQQSAANALPDVAYTVNGGTLNLNDFNATVASINQSAGAVTLGSAGATLTVTGATTQSGGTMDLSGGTGSFTTFTQTGSGSVFNTDGGTANFSGAVSLTDGAFHVNGGAANFNAGLTQNGASTFTNNASGATTVTGNYTMNGGTSTTSGSATTNVSGTLQLNGTSVFSVSDGTTGGTATVGAFSGVSGTTLNLGTGGTFNDNNASDQTFAGDITSTNGTFVLGNGTNTHTLTLTGDNQTGFTAGTIHITANSTLQAGTTAASNANALSTANYTVDGTLNANGNSFTTTGLTGAATGVVTLGTGTMTINETTGGPFTYNGTVSGAAGSAIVTAAATPTTPGNTQTQTLAGQIGGTGASNTGLGITVNGGTLVLSNTTNNYTGATNLNSTNASGTTTRGTLSIDSLSELGNTSSLNFNGGVLELTGNAIPTSFGSQAVNYSTFNGGIDVAQAGQTFTISSSPTTAQNLGGGNPLLINPNGGLGTVVLTGPANTYSTTTITSGTLQVGNGNLTGSLGTGAVTDNGNLLIDPANNATQTISNTISTTGSGTMEIGGTNTTVILTGDNAPVAFPGVVTTIDSGNTLKGAVTNLPGNVVDNGTLDFTQATDDTYAGSVTGTGNVIKDSAGTLTLSATNNYSGTTTINAGELDINGTTTSGTVTVEAAVTGSSTVTGGTLRGNGTLNANINNFGTVSPGTASNQTGILNQTGTFTNENGGTLVINVNGPASGTPTPGIDNSELNVTGSASLQTGSKTAVNITGNNFQLGVDYQAVNTTGGATIAAGATISTNLFFLKATFDQPTADVIDFQLTRSFVPNVNGVTFNQIQVGRYLDANSGNSNLDSITAALSSISNGADALNALTQLTGDIHPTMAQVNVNNTQIVIQQVAERLRGSNFAPGGPLAVAQDGTPIGTPVAFVGCDDNGMPEFDAGEPGCRAQWSGWSTGFGMAGATEFSGNATSANFGMGGVVAGLEHWEDDSHLVGLYGAYVGSGITVENGQNATMNGGQFGGYLFGDDGFNYYTALGGFEFDGDTTTRRVGFGTGTDAISDITNANMSDWQAFAYAERGMSFQSGNQVLQPFIGVQYIFVRQNAFTESGATNTAVNLSGSADSTNSLRSMLGTRMQWAMTNHAGRRTLPELHAMWVHEYLDTSSGLSATMVPVGGAPFIVQGLDVGRDWGVFGGNFTWEMVNGWSMFVNYDLQTNVRTTYNVGSGGIGYSW